MYNKEEGFWQIVDYPDVEKYDDLPYLEECRLKDLPKDHLAYGWFESVIQSNYCPMWEPEFFRMRYITASPYVGRSTL